MADFVKIADRMYEGASTDTKPTGVPNGTICRYTDTREVVITYDGGTTYINADKRVRLVEEDGSYIDLPGEFATLVLALQQSLESHMDAGEATGGGNTTLVDTGKSWEVNMWAGATFDIVIADKGYLGVVVSNTETTLTFAALAGAAAVVAGCPYGLKRIVRVEDVAAWGGTDLTGADVTLYWKALVDDGIKGLLKSIGDISTGENLVTRIGETDDAVVDAGATGSLSAQIKRLTTDLGALLVLIGEVQASPTENSLLERQKAIETALTALLTGITLAANSGVDIGDVDVEDRIGRLLGKITNYDVLVSDTLTEAEDTVELTAAGLASAGLDVRGTFDATIVVEGTVDGTNWEVIPIITPLLGTATASITAPGLWLVGCAGFLTIRARASVYASGTATIMWEGTSAAGAMYLTRSLPTGVNSIGIVAVTSMGEVQASPTANTLLGRLDEIEAAIDEINVLIGEVQASPTENSLLERQKAIETALTAIDTLIGAISASPTENTMMDRLKEVEDGIDEVKVLIGEVQAAPTENSLLERLKALETTLLTLVVLGAGTNLIGKVNIKHTPVITPTTDGESGETAIATLAPGAAFRLLGVRIHFSGALAAAETLTITKNSTVDAYDTLLFSLDIGTPDIVDVKIPFGDEDDFYSASDEIVIALSANTANRVWGCDTIHELV